MCYVFSEPIISISMACTPVLADHYHNAVMVKIIIQKCQCYEEYIKAKRNNIITVNPNNSILS